MMKDDTTYVEVAPAIPLQSGDSQTFTYQLSGTQRVKKFSHVFVPVGKRIVSGVVLDVHKSKPSYRTRAVSESQGVQLTRQQVAFARWIARTMHGGLGFTLRLFVPPRKPRLGIQSPSITLYAKEKPSLAEKLENISSAAIVEKDSVQKVQAVCDVAHWYASCGSQVLILVPELWMIELYAASLRDHMTSGVASIIHGGISQREAAQTWHNVRSGAAKIIIGTQKALFLPFIRLGLVILDEEQFDTHKLWDQYPRLHNRYGLCQLAKIHGAKMLYASSFPSVHVMHWMNKGRIEALRDSPLSVRLSVIGSTFEDQRHLRSVPHEFITALQRWLKDKEHVLVVHNQRQSFVGKVLKEMRFLRKSQLVFGTIGVFSRVKDEQFDRVAWLFPERSLRYPDYRSYERSMVLLTRLKQHVKGARSVTLVTRYPQFIQEQLAVSLGEFYRRQLKEREKYYNPPYADMVRLTIVDKSGKRAQKRAEVVRQKLDLLVSQQSEKILVRGPFEAFGQRRNGHSELHIVLQGPVEKLSGLYSGLDIDSADLAPHRVL